MMNWKQEGMSDASQAKPPRDLSRSIEDCQKYNLRVDTAAYQEGYALGVKQFCQPTFEMGQQDGQLGKSLSDISNNRQSFCTNNLKPLNLKDYTKGLNAGLVAFCTAENGYSMGMRGEAASNACSSDKYSYMKGWQKGSVELCGNKSNGFIYGKEGKGYPAACTGPGFSDFKIQYDRGTNIKQRVDQINNNINSLNKDIDTQVRQYGLRKMSNDSYAIGANQSSEAYNALYSVQNSVQQRKQLNKELFQISMMQ
jgi:hypothetical protein